MNVAVSEWVPFGNDVILKAKPAVAGMGLPSGLFPSKNWTVPAVLNGDTRAIRISGINVKLGFGVTCNEVVVNLIPGGVGGGVGELTI